MAGHQFNRYEKTTPLSKSLKTLWDSFWYPPGVICPKCKGGDIEYYDPFLFSIVRTFRGTRRYKCRRCRFIWRLNRGRGPFGTHH